MNKDILKQAILEVCPKVKNPDDWANLMDGVLVSFGIDTPSRIAMFLAQCMHECGCFRFMKELWGPTKWQVRYEGHKGLGNTQPGDGKKFLGRGMVQISGRKNYKQFADWCNDQSIMERPEQLEEPGYALLSAIWFWNTNGLNTFADKGDVSGATRRINGPGMLGLAERQLHYEKALGVLEQRQV